MTSVAECTQAYGLDKSASGCSHFCKFIEHMISDHGGDLVELFNDESDYADKAIVRPNLCLHN